jgi:hypothetical protein
MYGILPLIRKRSRRLVGALEDRFLEIRAICADHEFARYGLHP